MGEGEQLGVMWRRALVWPAGTGYGLGNCWGVVPDVGGNYMEEVLALNGEGPLRRVYPGG